MIRIRYFYSQTVIWTLRWVPRNFVLIYVSELILNSAIQCKMFIEKATTLLGHMITFRIKKKAKHFTGIICKLANFSIFLA